MSTIVPTSALSYSSSRVSGVIAIVSVVLVLIALAIGIAALIIALNKSSQSGPTGPTGSTGPSGPTGPSLSNITFSAMDSDLAPIAIPGDGVLTFPIEVYDASNTFSSNQFVATQAGVYAFTSNVQIQITTPSPVGPIPVTLTLRHKTGTSQDVVSGDYIITNSATSMSAYVNVSGEMLLAVGDTVNVVLNVTPPSGTTITVFHRKFYGHRLS